jgi:ribosomal protein S18 acetylase RimI-like enzyme
VDFQLIDPAHPSYPGELELRFRVLREPLGHTREQVKFPFEGESLHLVALEGSAVVGCVLFHPETPTGGRLFQMAVKADQQGTGLGRRLVEELERELQQRGFTEVHLHARAPVVGFYERLGYRVYGDPFVEVGIEHRLMQRSLG